MLHPHSGLTIALLIALVSPTCHALPNNGSDGSSIPDRDRQLTEKDNIAWNLVIENTLLEAFTLSALNGPGDFQVTHAKTIGCLVLDKNTIELSYGVNQGILNVSMAIPSDNCSHVEQYNAERLSNVLNDDKYRYSLNGTLSPIPFNKWLYLYTAINSYHSYLSYLRYPSAKALLGPDVDLEALVRDPGSFLGVKFVLPEDCPLVVTYEYKPAFEDSQILYLKFSSCGIPLDDWSVQIYQSSVNAKSRAGFSGEVKIGGLAH